MIGVAAVRGPGGLTRHLHRTDTNEEVIVRDDLSNDCALETEAAIADFAALGAAQNIEKCLLHVAMSPALPLTPEQERRMIALIREVYGISVDQPCHVLQHIKPGPTARPSHYHLVVPRYDNARKKQIASSYTHIKNERVSLQLEVEFGHPLVPGPHLDAVRETLSKERPDIAVKLEGLTAPSRTNDALKVGDLAKAHDHDLDLFDFRARLLKAWMADRLGPTSLARAKARLAHGDKALMVVDLETGSSHSLVRLLNSASKAMGQPLRLKQADLATLRATVPEDDDLPKVAREVISKAVETSRADASAAWLEAQREAQASFDLQLQRRLKREAEEAEAARRQDQVKLTIKGQVAAIRAARQEATRVRRETLVRARRTLNFWRSPGLARGVGIAAAVMTGSIGIGLAVMTTTAIVAVVRRSQARGEIRAARSGGGFTAVRDQIRGYYDEVNEARRFDPGAIPQRVRVVAGAMYRAVDEGREPDAAWTNALEAAGEGLADKVKAFAEYNVRPHLRARMLAMYEPARDAGALAQALRPAIVEDPEGFQHSTIKPQAATPAAHSRAQSTTSVRVTTTAQPQQVSSAKNPGINLHAVQAGVAPVPSPKPAAITASAPPKRDTQPPRSVAARDSKAAIPQPADTRRADETSNPPATAQWSPAAIPEKLQALAGFYVHLLLVGPRRTLQTLGPSLEQKLGIHADELKQQVRTIQKVVRAAKKAPEDNRLQNEKSALLAEREALLRMANPLRVDASSTTALFKVSALNAEMQKHGIDTKIDADSAKEPAVRGASEIG